MTSVHEDSLDATLPPAMDAARLAAAMAADRATTGPELGGSATSPGAVIRRCCATWTTMDDGSL